MGETLLMPTRIYVRPLLALAKTGIIKGLVHITGGGFWENIPRILPAGVRVELQRSRWPRMVIFDYLQKLGHIDEVEMLRTFNCGIGMIVIVPADAADRALTHLEQSGEQAWLLGQVMERNLESEPQVTILD